MDKVPHQTDRAFVESSGPHPHFPEREIWPSILELSASRTLEESLWLQAFNERGPILLIAGNTAGGKFFLNDFFEIMFVVMILGKRRINLPHR